MSALIHLVDRPRRSSLLAGFVALALIACGSSSNSSNAGAGGSSGSGRPPSAPGGPVADGTTPTILAMDQLLLGDTNASGQPDKNAWKSLGYDIDGLQSTPASTNHCQPIAGGSKAAIQSDGNAGIDNSFGRNLLPILTILQPTTSQRVNQSLTTGEFTIVFALKNLGTAATEIGVSSAIFGGTALPLGARPPHFDGTDVWPVSSNFVANHDVNQPTLTFPSSYVVDDTWVSGSGATIDVPLVLSGFSLNLHIQSAIVSMRVSGRGANATATGGIIAGVMETERFVSEMKQLVGAINPSLCAPTTFDGIAQTIRGASDIMLDGTNGDPTKSCNAISIGLGFAAGPVKLGPVVDPPTSVDPCAP